MPWRADGGFTYGPGDEAALARMNAVRAKMGLPPLSMGDSVSLDDINAARTSGYNTPTADEPDTEVPLNAAGQTPGQAEITRKSDIMGGMTTPFSIGSGDPGAQLDTTLGDQDRARMGDLLAQLQQQAATGSGSWEGVLKAASERSQATASALGQAQANEGGNYGSALQNIGNAQSGAAQRAVGQGNILRAQSQADAQQQLSALLAGQGTQDVEQARAQAAARQATRAVNEDLSQQAAAGRQKTAAAAGQGLLSFFGLSDGGQVPGRAPVFGNDERNDTVSAMLSPGEVVLPRTISRDPRAAAAFVAALNAGADPNAAERQAGSGVRHMADGGDTEPPPEPWMPGDPDPAGTKPWKRGGGDTTSSGDDILNWLGGTRQAPSAESGGLLDTRKSLQSREQNLMNDALLRARASGMGPSVAPQMMQNANDAAIFEAMSAQGRAPSATLVSGASREAQLGGGDAARTSAREASGAQQELSRSLLSQRERDMALAGAQQQAAFRNSMMNVGVALERQQALQNIFSGAAQGVGAVGGALSGGGGKGGSSDMSTWDTGEISDYYGERGGPADISDPEDKAFGGPVGYAGGGKVDEGGAARRRRERQERKQSEWDEEEAGPYSEKKRMKPVPDAASLLADFARSLGAKMGASLPRRLYDGGSADDFPARRDSGPIIYDANGMPIASGGHQPPPAATMPPTMPPWYVAPQGSVRPGDLPAGMPSSAPPQSRYPPPAGGAAAHVELTPTEQAISNEAAAPNANISAKRALEHRAARDAAGIKPGAAPAGGTTTPAAPASSAPARAGGAGVALPPSHQLEEGFASNEAQLAAQALTEAEVAKARATEAGIAERAKAQADAQIAIKEARARARQQTNEAMTRWRADQEEFNRIDTKVDPGRYWASKNTGQKILGIIGLALGAVGAGADGINRAAQMMNNAIDRDLDAQKAEYELRLKKGGQRLQAAQTYYAMAREAGHDDITGTELAKAAVLEGAALKSEQLVAATAEPVAKAKGQALAAALRGAAIDKTKVAEQQTFENRVKNQTLNISAAGARGGVGAAEGKDLRAAEANAQDSLDLIRSIRGSLTRTQSAVPGVMAVRQNFGEESPNIETAATELTLKLKDMAKLGQISASDSTLLDKLVGDPQAVWGKGSSEAAKQHRLKALEDIVLRSIQNQRSATGGVQAR